MPLRVYVLIITAVVLSAVGRMALNIAVERAHLKEAIAAGAVGAALGNLAVTTVAVLAFDHGRRWLRQRVRPAA